MKAQVTILVLVILLLADAVQAAPAAIELVEHVGAIHKEAAGFFLRVPATATVAEQDIFLAARDAAVEKELAALHEANAVVRLHGVAGVRAGRTHLVVTRAARVRR